MEYYAAIKKNEILSFAITWIDLEKIMLGKISQRKTNITYMWNLKIIQMGASLVAQWLRICLPMQGTQVRALVWEDPTCRGATKPVRYNY